jgi:hypothetical protein
MQNLWQFKSLCPCQKKPSAKALGFFNEIHPCGWNKSSLTMKSPSGMKSASTAEGGISYAQKISSLRKQGFH